MSNSKKFLLNKFNEFRFHNLEKVDPWKLLLVLFIILNILLRFHFVDLFSQYPIQAKEPGSDESGYINLGLHFQEWLLHGNTIRLPVYPAFISLFVQNGLAESTIYMAQHIIFLISSLFLSYVLFNSWNWRLLSFNLIIYYGPFVINSNGALTETLTVSILMVAISVFIWAKNKRWGQIFGSFLFGLLALTRPNFLFLFPFIIGILYITRQITIRKLILFFLTFTLPVFCWMLRNYAIQGSLTYCTIGGEQLFRESRVFPPSYTDEMKYFNDVLGPDRPDNLKRTYSSIWNENIYGDNKIIFLPINADYPLKNDVITDRYYKKLAIENYTYYIKNRPDLLFNKVSLWIRNYPSTCVATFEYTQYRNSTDYIHSRYIDLLYILSTVYDVVFFPLGLLFLILISILIFKFPKYFTDYKLSVILFSVLFYSLIFPIPTQIGGRFTMIYMLAVIFSSLYFIFSLVIPWIKNLNKK